MDRRNVGGDQPSPLIAFHFFVFFMKFPMPSDDELLNQLPSESSVLHIAFARDVQPGQTVLHELPFPWQIKAVVAGSPNSGSTSLASTVVASAGPLQILTIPAAVEDDPQVLTDARSWTVNTNSGSTVPCLPVTLHGAQIFWSPARAAVIAASDRMPAVQAAIIEFCYFEGELRAIEREIGSRWSQLEIDTPLAFEFHEQAIAERKELVRRFQMAISIRTRIAKLAPAVECPPVFPPTLASQVSERLKEKSRLSDRLEFVREQTEVFERVYEMCGQRASDFMASRKSHMLEWTIIFLLAVETLLLAVELLPSTKT